MRNNRLRHEGHQPSNGVFLLWLILVALMPLLTALTFR
jgi:hypothetical protein